MRTGSTRPRSTCSSRLIDRLLRHARAAGGYLPPWNSPRRGLAVRMSPRFNLTALGAGSAQAMVAGVAGGKALPVEVLDEIVAKTDGVPLFVEELTKTCIESPACCANRTVAYVLNRALTPLAIPSTLQDPADGAARSPRAGQGNRPSRSGDRARVFLPAAGSDLAGIQGVELQDALAQLMAAELIHGRGAPPEATYVFKLCARAGHGLRLTKLRSRRSSASTPTSHGRWRSGSRIRSTQRRRSSRVITPKLRAC